MSGRRIAVALGAGLIVFALLLPVHGIDPIPPVCFAVVGYVVPCEGGIAAAVGVVTALIVGLVLWLTGRRRATT